MFGYNGDMIPTWIIFVVVLVPTYVFVTRRRQFGNLPPGPTPYPLVGNLFQLFGKDLRQVCRDYRKKYGDIFTIHVLDRTMILVCGPHNIKDAFVKRAMEFSDRPAFKATHFKGDGVIQASGEIWKHNRRFTVHTLRDFGMGKNKIQIRVQEEMSYFLEAIEEQRGNAFDMKDIINASVSNIICSIVFGKRFDYGDPKFLENVRHLDELIKANTFTKPSWARYIPGDPFNVKKSYRCAGHLFDFHTAKVQEHLKDFDGENLRDFIDVYIKQMKEKEEAGEESAMNVHELVRILHDLFLAGTETTTTALRFGMACLLRHPDIQTRLSNDIQKVVPENRLPDLSDRPNLPFVEATVFEILRRGCLTPFGGPHTVREDTEYKGFSIPKSAIVFPHLESVLMDDELWDDPLKFNPSRFLDDKMSLVKTENLIPFSVGPRICLGDGLAKTEMFLFLSAMLQRFKFLPPEGEDPPSLDTVYGTVCGPKPFKLRAVRL